MLGQLAIEGRVSALIVYNVCVCMCGKERKREKLALIGMKNLLKEHLSFGSTAERHET